MHRLLCLTLVLSLTATPVVAHFVYVVPTKDGKNVQVVFSDDLEPDENVKIEKVAGLKLTLVFADGKTAPLELKTDKHSFVGEVSIVSPQYAFGSVVYGLTTKGDMPSLLVYHPKVVFAGTTAKQAVIGPKAALEVVPVTEAGSTKFQLLGAGVPVVNAEGSVLLPDGKKEKLKTDKDGYTAAFVGSGRYAVWLRHIDAKPGEHDGKKYTEAKHYATLVVDVAGK